MSAAVPIKDIGDVYEGLADVRDMIQCVWMASGLVDMNDPLQVVCDCAIERLEFIREGLGALIKKEAAGNGHREKTNVG